MSLREKLTNDLKEAMKSGDVITRDTIRLMLAQFQSKTQEVKDLAIKKGEKVLELTEEELIACLQTFKKNTEEEMEGQAQRGNSERVQHLDNTRAVVIRYLPKQLNREQIEQIVSDAIAGGANNQGEIRKVIMPLIKGQADNKVVSEIIGELLKK